MSFGEKLSHFLFMVYVCDVSYTTAVGFVVDYKLNLSSSGPALYGSVIKFDAKLFEGTSLTPQDKELFKYDWKSDVDRITETQHADFNTSLNRCFDSSVIPRNYTMTVTVYDMKSSLFIPIVKKSLNFSITDTLNGNLQHDQTIHRREGVGKNVFSTQKPISFLVNVTDMFKEQPSFTYKWYSDGQSIDADNYDNRTISIKHPGGHNVSVIVSSNGFSSDCKGYLYENELKGSFQASFVLKDPVLHMKLYGHKKIDLGQNTSLTAVFNGSSPYVVCWELLSSDNVVIVNRSCTNEPDPESPIYLAPEYFSKIGLYTLNISIENDISVYYSQQMITVDSAPSPTTMSPGSHSPAHILVPVICALVAVTMLMFVAVYFMNKRKKRQHIESANFDFHTSIRQTPSRGSILSDVKDLIGGLLHDTDTRRTNYGAVDNPPVTA